MEGEQASEYAEMDRKISEMEEQISDLKSQIYSPTDGQYYKLLLKLETELEAEKERYVSNSVSGIDF